jgi:hypothetical protein
MCGGTGFFGPGLPATVMQAYAHVGPRVRMKRTRERLMKEF